MSRNAVRMLFVAAALGLLLQYGIVGLVSLDAGEPWPAVLQPGFKSVWDGGDTIRIPQADLEVELASGDIRPLPLDRLFEGIPASHHLGLLRTQFQPARLSGSPQTERFLSPDAAEWLRQRIVELYPGEHPEHARAVWKELHFDRAAQSTTTVPLDTLIISFADR